MSTTPPLVPLSSILARPRAEALEALGAAGWRIWNESYDLDAERRRLLNVDLTEPELVFLEPGAATAGGAAVAAVAHLEADIDGQVVLFEVTGTEPVPPRTAADRLVPGVGEPRTAGGVEAREWIWGPEAGHQIEAGGEPVRLWICTERAYGDRLWAIGSLVRRLE